MSIKTNVVTSDGSILALAVSDVANASTLVDGFRNRYWQQTSGDRKEAKALADNSRKALYQNLGAFYGIAVVLLDPKREEILLDVLAEHGLRPARKGANLYGPLAQVMFGEWREFNTSSKKKPKAGRQTKTVDGKLFEFVPNRSAEKYAKAARFFQFKKWSPSEVATQLEQYPGKLSGVVTDDNNRTRKTDIDQTEEQKLVDLLLDKKPASSLLLGECGLKPEEVEDRKLVSLWAEIKDGQVCIHGALPMSEAFLDMAVRKIAKREGTSLLLKKLNEGNSQVIEGLFDSTDVSDEKAA